MRGRRCGERLDPAPPSPCGEGAGLASHLLQPAQDAAEARFRAIVGRLASRRGAVVDALPGTYVRGTAKAYADALGPGIDQALRARGYLPPPAGRWSDLWSKAPYRFAYAIRETYEGTYLGTENRLTRIDALLLLSGPGGATWQTSPNARTIVPVRGMPSYLASRLALGSGRVDEAERILYEDAFAHICDRFRGGLANLPGCGKPPATSGAENR